jgi:hypothetical protein
MRLEQRHAELTAYIPKKIGPAAPGLNDDHRFVDGSASHSDRPTVCDDCVKQPKCPAILDRRVRQAR